MMKRDTCIEELKDIIWNKNKNKNKEDGQKTFEECGALIKRVIECRHNRVMHRQKQKFENLQQKKIGCSNKGTHIDTDGDNTTEDTS